MIESSFGFSDWINGQNMWKGLSISPIFRSSVARSRAHTQQLCVKWTLNTFVSLNKPMWCRVVGFYPSLELIAVLCFLLFNRFTCLCVHSESEDEKRINYILLVYMRLLTQIWSPSSSSPTFGISHNLISQETHRNTLNAFNRRNNSFRCV